MFRNWLLKVLQGSKRKINNMPMRACDKCLNNSWEFNKLPDNWIEATCNLCGNSVQFEARSKKKIESDTDRCGKCNGRLVWTKQRFLTVKRLEGAFHFCKSLRCTKCRQLWMVERFRTLQGNPCDCPRRTEPPRIMWYHTHVWNVISATTRRHKLSMNTRLVHQRNAKRRQRKGG
jgi:predicted metal-binding protein